MKNEPIDVEAKTSAQSDLPAIREAGAVGPAMPPPDQSKAPITAAQAKVDAVAALTMQAYSRAASLELTEEEIAKLTAEFPDEAFKPGASGKEHLLYIEHPFLRDRLNQVFRPGQWAIVPRSRWAEPFRTKPSRDNPNGTEGQRVYVEAMLMVKGCFVAEAIGDMDYFPSNGSQNYGDAVEGAKTAALRRCCKEMGVGLQAWKKDWCEGWWARKRSGQRAPAAPTRPAAEPAPTTHAPAAPKPPPIPTVEQRAKMIAKLKAGPGEPNRELVTEYFRKLEKPSVLMPNEELEEMPLWAVPATYGQMGALENALTMFGQGERAVHAFPPNGEALAEGKPKTAKPIEVPRENPSTPDDGDLGPEEPWRAFPMPFGKSAGVPLGELDKKYLYGLWANYTVETEFNGRPKKPETIAKDTVFREMLDAAGQHYEFTKKD